MIYIKKPRRHTRDQNNTLNPNVVLPNHYLCSGNREDTKADWQDVYIPSIFNDGERIQIGALYTAVTRYMDTPCSLTKYDNLKYLRWI